MSTSSRKPSSAGLDQFANFMINGTDEEHERVFMKVIDESIKDQQKIIEQAERIRAEKARKNKLDDTSSGTKTG